MPSGATTVTCSAPVATSAATARAAQSPPPTTAGTGAAQKPCSASSHAAGAETPLADVIRGLDDRDAGGREREPAGDRTPHDPASDDHDGVVPHAAILRPTRNIGV